MQIKEYLKEKNINYTSHSHPPVLTCEEAKLYSKNIRGIHSKNLFLKDRKSRRFYLLILPEFEQVDMNSLSETLQDKIKFANADNLKDILNTTTGAVSPFALINDVNHEVKLVIDKRVWGSEFVSFHPNINTETLELTHDEFHKYVNSLKNELVII